MAPGAVGVPTLSLWWYCDNCRHCRQTGDRGRFLRFRKRHDLDRRLVPTKENYLSLTGYRLHQSAEWEYACETEVPRLGSTIILADSACCDSDTRSLLPQLVL